MREMPRSDRPRERLIDLGVHALSTAELLALLLGSGSKDRPALQLGQAVFSAFGGSLRRIARDPVASLTAIPGVGLARAVGIHAALELGRRLAGEERQPGAPIQSPRDVVQWYAPRMEDLPVEEFHVAVLDTKALAPGSRIDFTWREGGEWAGRDITVMVRSGEAAGPVAAA